MKVYTYYNLHKQTFSIKALEGPQKGKVIAHRDEVWLKDVVPVVSELRVLRDKQKNVHAGIVGDWIPNQTLNEGHILDKVTYDPYKYDSFVSIENQKEYTGSPLALLWNKQVWGINYA